MMAGMNRRHFLKTSLAGVAALGPGAAKAAIAADSDTGLRVMTVQGWILAERMGVTLPHEHVTTDFIGAEKARTPRYDRNKAFDLILPYFEKLKQRGASTLVECTPRYIGRDVSLLLRLSRASGLHLLTNTGYYGAVDNKYLPRHAHDESAEQLAARWLGEWRDGIEGTGVRPGFIKLGVGKGPLSELHRKLVGAAAEVHLSSGLTICIHTGDGEAALDELSLLRSCGIAPEAFVWVHAQNDPGPVQLEVAARGGWVSLDGYNTAHRNPDRYLNFLLALRREKLLHRVLLSHDDGWAVEGTEPQGATLKRFGNGNPLPYESLFTRLIPDLKNAGFTDEEIRQLLQTNPRNALAVRVRAL